MDRRKNKILIYITFFLGFLAILALNRRTHYISDDFIYKFQFYPELYPLDIVAGDSLYEVEGITSLLKSQYHHYHMWNGRFVAHIMIQFLMLFDKWVFNILNTLVFLALGWLIAKISSYVSQKKIPAILLIGIYLILFLSIPVFGQTVLWISGSVNYLWLSLIYLGFFYFNLKDREDSLLTILTAGLFGLLAGATNENTGPALLLMVVLLAIYKFMKTRQISIWRIAGILSSFVGFLLILLAPAASNRVEEKGEISLSFEEMVESFQIISRYIIENHLTYVLLILFLTVILLANKRLHKQLLVTISVLFIGYLASAYSLVAVNKLIARTLFGPTIFLITIFAILFLEFIDYINNLKLLGIVMLPLILIFMYVYTIAFIDIDKTHEEVLNQYKIMNQQPGEDVLVPMISTPETNYNAYNNGTNYIKEDKDFWLNIYIAEFFNVNSVEGYTEELN